MIKPNPDAVNSFLQEWHTLENYKLQEQSLSLLFHKFCPGNTMLEYVLLKVIRASRVKDCRKVQLAIECKCLKPFFPLLIYQTPRTDEENYHEIIYSFKTSPRMNYGLPPNSASNERFSGKYSLYREIKFVGKSTVQVGKNAQTKEFVGDDSEIFDKWSQALNSAHDLIVESVNYQERYKSRCFFTITLPLLVVSDETLWTVNYSREGVQEGVPKEADHATIYIGKDYLTGSKGESYTISYLHVFTLKAFKKYMRRLVADDDPNEYIWDEFFPYDKLAKLKSDNS
jgi:hypothetical protein